MMARNQRMVLVGVLYLMVTVCSSIAATSGHDIIRVTQHTPSPRAKRDVGGPRILSGQDFPQRMEFTLHLADRDLKLSMEKHASPADVKMRDEKGADIHVQPQDDRLQYGIYQDVDAVSTMTIECWDNAELCKLTGSFYTDGKKWLLEPVKNSPDKYSMKEAASGFKSDTVKGVNKGDAKGAPHVPGLFEELLEGVLRSEKARTAAEKGGRDVTNSLANHHRRKRSNPIHTTCNIIEVLVVVDSTIWQYFLDRNSNDADAAEVELRKYYLALFGQVDLRYKCLETYGICIRVYLRELRIEKTSGFAVPDSANPPFMDVIPSLVNCGAKRLHYAPHLDLAICLTRQRFIWTNGSPDFRSFSFFGVLCDVGHNAYQSLVSEDFQDDQDLLIAHAMLFPFNINSDGAIGCDDDDRFIGSNLNLPPFNPSVKTNPWEFSVCTRTQLQQRLASGALSCLNYGDISVNELDSELESRRLPGKIFDLDFQCEHAFGAGSQSCIGPGESTIIGADHICSLGVYCTVNGNCVNRTRVFNGSPCGCNKHCYKNECIKIKNVTLGGACEGCCECEDPNAECDCDTNTCRCKDGFFASTGTCVPSIPNGGNCAQPGSSCADSNAQCIDDTCQCVDGFVLVNGTCVTYKCLNDNCTDSAECGRVQGTCINGVCKCDDTSYADQHGVCQPRVPLGGNCSGNAVCDDDRAFCNPVTSECECIPPTFDSNGAADGGMCLDPIPNGDNCTQADSCADSNARCTDNTCQCADGFVLVNGICVSYKCLNDNCTDSAECGRVQGTCINGVCKCNDTSYADQCGVCQPRVPLGGNCSGNAVCDDDRAFCNSVTSTCECIPPTFDSNGAADGGMCLDPIPNGENCTQADSCADSNAQCIDNACQCADGFVLVNGICVRYKCLNDNCTDNAECSRVQGTCINGVCKCNDTSYADQCGICQPRVPLGGNCSGNAVCDDDRAFCNSVTSTCECIPPTFDSNGAADGGMCLDPIPTGDNCTQADSCADSNAQCIDNSCQCADGFVLVNGICVRYKCLNDNCTDNAECGRVQGTCINGVCKCNDTSYADQCGICQPRVPLGGNCSGNAVCDDDRAFCNSVTSTCECIPPTFDSNGAADGGMCLDPIPNGDNCTQADSCADSNAQCIDNACQCADGFVLVNGICVRYKCLNDNCTDNAECGRVQGTCINGVCKCNDTSYADQYGICQPRVPLGGNCSGNAVCDDDRAFCNSVTSTCECIPPTFDSNGAADGGMCLDPIPTGDNCTLADSCADSNAQCIDNACQCADGFVLVNGICVRYKCLNDNCTDNAECGRVQGTCINGVCKCNDTSYADQCGICQPRVPLGGNCSGNAVCDDDRAFCNSVTSTCECIPPTFDSNGAADGGMCLDPIPNGDNCTQADSCADSNAQCIDNACQCADGFVLVNRICVRYKCLNDNCTDNAECGRVQGTCINGVCKCNDTSYADQYGICQPRVPLGGNCSGNAVCDDDRACCNSVTSTCECIPPTFDSNGAADGGMCLDPIPNGDNCTLADSCADSNAQCIDNACQCADGFVLVNGICVRYKCLNDNCTDNAECGRVQGTCINGVCKCNDTSYADQCGICQPRVPLGGNCSGNAVCEDDRAFCNPITSVCECTPPTFDSNGAASDGMCLDPIPNGGSCTVNSSCADPNAVCIGTCQCGDGFSLVGGVCTQDDCPPGISDLGGPCQNDSNCVAPNSVCVNSICVCSNDTVFNATRNVCMVQNGYACIVSDPNCIDPNAECKKGSECCDAVCLCADDYYRDVTDPCGGLCILRPVEGEPCSTTDPCDDVCSNSTCKDGLCAGGAGLFETCRAAVSCSEYPTTKCVTYASQGITPPAGSVGSDKICLCDDNDGFYQIEQFCFCNPFGNVTNPKCD